MNDLLERQLAHEQLLTDYTLMRAVAQYAVDNQNDPAEVARYAQAMMDEVDNTKKLITRKGANHESYRV